MPSCSKCHRDLFTGALFCAACGAPVVPDQGEKVDPFIGQTFRGTYFIQQKIGSGGMGQVYKAMHVTLDVPVALKVLRKALLADPAIVQRFYREARAASRLRHPNVIGVTDFGQLEDGTLFMAMEYVAGKSLARLIAEEFPLSEQRVVRIGSQILAALSEAHAAQILHRDLKPENVMVESRRDEHDAVKVLDFGIAKIQVAGEAQGMTLTQAGLVCGTPGYMSPEQWSGEPLDGRADLYAVGVILYEMLTGKLPFESNTPMEMMRKHLTEQPRPPSTRRKDGSVSPDLEALVMRAISSSPGDRPPSADAMRQDLLACVLLPPPSEGPSTSEVRKTVVLPRQPRAKTPTSPAKGTPVLAPDVTAETLPRAPAATRPSPPQGASMRPPTRSPPTRPPTPAPSTRLPTPAPSSAARSPILAPRHEEDEPEILDETSPQPPPRNRTPLVVAAALGVTVVVAAGIYLASRGGAKPERPPETAKSTPAPARKVEPPPVQVVAPAPQEAPQAREAVPASPPAVAAEVLAAVPAERASPPRPPPKRPSAKNLPATVASAENATAAPVEGPIARRPFLVRDTLNSIPVPPASSGDGVLSVLAEPYGDVFLDGTAYGDAPKEFRLHAGTHSVRVTHPQFGAREARVVVVAGRRKPWIANFEQ
jgi:serine/threonine-protein kinase